MELTLSVIETWCSNLKKTVDDVDLEDLRVSIIFLKYPLICIIDSKH